MIYGDKPPPTSVDGPSSATLAAFGALLEVPCSWDNNPFGCFCLNASEAPDELQQTTE